MAPLECAIVRWKLGLDTWVTLETRRGAAPCCLRVEWAIKSAVLESLDNVDNWKQENYYLMAHTTLYINNIIRRITKRPSNTAFIDFRKISLFPHAKRNTT
jgi:hypothetical protein